MLEPGKNIDYISMNKYIYQGVGLEVKLLSFAPVYIDMSLSCDRKRDIVLRSKT